MAAGGRRIPGEDYDDRLSRLPDCLILHILSFLPTRFAISTFVFLSSRWRYIYRQFTSFDLDDPTPKPFGKYYNDEFMEFVRRILIKTKPNSVSNFRLSSSSPIKSVMVFVWILDLLYRDVKVLDIKLPQLVTSLTLPNRMFTQKNLMVLKLSGQTIDLPERNFLPNLKIFHLDSMTVKTSRNICWEISTEGYPSLEDLRIANVKFTETGIFGITLPTLIRFTSVNHSASNLRYYECDTHLGGFVPFAAEIREVKINRFMGKETELESLKGLLEHGSKLEVVSLTASPDGRGWPFTVTKELVKFSRCSKKCELLLN